MSAEILRPETPPCALAMDASMVVDIDPALVDSPDGNREVDAASVEPLASDIADNGQVQPAILCPHPTKPGRYLCVDGNRRKLACQMLGRKLRAVLLDKPPTEPELIRLRMSSFMREGLDAVDIAANLWAYMNATGCSQEELAGIFKLSPGYVSKLLAPYRTGTPELLQALRERRLVLTAGPMLAKLPPDVQLALLPMCVGKKRSSVDAIVAQHAAKGKPKARGKKLKVTRGGFTLTGSDATFEALQAFLDWIAGGMKQAGKCNVGIDMLPALLKE